MPTELSELIIPSFSRAIGAMQAFLDKGRAHADAHGMPHAELLDARLYADMAPLTAQVQRVSDTAKGAIVRLAGIDNIAMPDTEVSFAELHDRLQRTLDFVHAAPREAIDGKEAAPVVLQTPGGEIPFTGISYVQGFVLPNLYFHVTTGYAILRMKGVPLGKLDYLGQR